MEYLSPPRRLRIPKKKNYHWTRTRQKACSLQVPSSAPRTFFSSLPTTWNTKRRTVVLNRVCIWEIFCPKQSQGFKHSAAYLYPNIGRVPPPRALLTLTYTQILVEYPLWGLPTLTLACTQILVEYPRSPEAEASTSTRKSTYLGYVYTKYHIVFAPVRKPYRMELLFTRRYLKWRATYRIGLHTIPQPSS